MHTRYAIDTQLFHEKKATLYLKQGKEQKGPMYGYSKHDNFFFFFISNLFFTQVCLLRDFTVLFFVAFVLAFSYLSWVHNLPTQDFLRTEIFSVQFGNNENALKPKPFRECLFYSEVFFFCSSFSLSLSVDFVFTLVCSRMYIKYVYADSVLNVLADTSFVDVRECMEQRMDAVQVSTMYMYCFFYEPLLFSSLNFRKFINLLEFFMDYLTKSSIPMCFLMEN